MAFKIQIIHQSSITDVGNIVQVANAIQFTGAIVSSVPSLLQAVLFTDSQQIPRTGTAAGGRSFYDTVFTIADGAAATSVFSDATTVYFQVSFEVIDEAFPDTGVMFFNTSDPILIELLNGDSNLTQYAFNFGAFTTTTDLGYWDFTAIIGVSFEKVGYEQAELIIYNDRLGYMEDIKQIALINIARYSGTELEQIKSILQATEVSFSDKDAQPIIERLVSMTIQVFAEAGEPIAPEQLEILFNPEERTMALEKILMGAGGMEKASLKRLMFNQLQKSQDKNTREFFRQVDSNPALSKDLQFISILMAQQVSDTALKVDFTQNFEAFSANFIETFAAESVRQNRDWYDEATGLIINNPNVFTTKKFDALVNMNIPAQFVQHLTSLQKNLEQVQKLMRIKGEQQYEVDPYFSQGKLYIQNILNTVGLRNIDPYFLMAIPGALQMTKTGIEPTFNGYGANLQSFFAPIMASMLAVVPHSYEFLQALALFSPEAVANGAGIVAVGKAIPGAGLVAEHFVGGVMAASQYIQYLPAPLRIATKVFFPTLAATSMTTILLQLGIAFGVSMAVQGGYNYMTREPLDLTYIPDLTSIYKEEISTKKHYKIQQQVGDVLLFEGGQKALANTESYAVQQNGGIYPVQFNFNDEGTFPVTIAHPDGQNYLTRPAFLEEYRQVKAEMSGVKQLNPQRNILGIPSLSGNYVDDDDDFYSSFSPHEAFGSGVKQVPQVPGVWNPGQQIMRELAEPQEPYVHNLFDYEPPEVEPPAEVGFPDPEVGIQEPVPLRPLNEEDPDAPQPRRRVYPPPPILSTIAFVKWLMTDDPEKKYRERQQYLDEAGNCYVLVDNKRIPCEVYLQWLEQDEKIAQTQKAATILPLKSKQHRATRTIKKRGRPTKKKKR